MSKSTCDAHSVPELKPEPRESPEPTIAARKSATLDGLPNELRYLVTASLAQQDLGRLATTSKGWERFVTPILYKANATYSNSSAIKLAALVGSGRAENPVSLCVLEKALKCGGDANAIHHDGSGNYASALHIAAATGKHKFVRTLLKNGAKVTLLSKGLSKMHGIGLRFSVLIRKLGNTNLISAAESSLWLPLFIPLVLDDMPIIKLLVSYGATGHLAIPAISNRVEISPYGFVPSSRGLGVAHVMAATHMQPVQVCSPLHSLFKGSKDLKLASNGFAPFHIALTAINKAIFDDLIKAEASVNSRTDLGRTPLCHAIRECYQNLARENRSFFLDCMEILLHQGANPNSHSHQVVAETPLIAMVQSTPHEWNAVAKEMRIGIDILLERGAQINEMASSGLNVMHYLCEEIRSKKGNASLEKLLKYLVRRGGSLNIPMNGDSILKRFVVDSQMEPFKSVKLLIQLGAKVLPHEAGNLLQAWVCSKPLREICEIRDYANHITQRSINEAYFSTFANAHEPAFVALREQFPTTTITEQLLFLMLRYPQCRKLGKAYRLFEIDFNPNYKNKQGQGFLHVIVDELRKLGEGVTPAKEKVAVEDARSLIHLNTSLLLKDSGGKTALQRLYELGQPLEKLKLLLHEAKDKETGEL